MANVLKQISKIKYVQKCWLFIVSTLIAYEILMDLILTLYNIYRPPPKPPMRFLVVGKPRKRKPAYSTPPPL